MTRRVNARAITVSVCSWLLLGASLIPTAQAADPGANGRLFFSTRRPLDIYSVDISTVDPLLDPDGDARSSGMNSSKDDFSPYWSPDGKEMAFQSNRDGDMEIFICTAATGLITQLTN